MLNTGPISLSLKEGQFNYSIKFPNTGQLIKIENFKNELAGNSYDQLYFRQDIAGVLAKLNIDAIATLTVLCPDLLKDLQVNSLRDLDLIYMAELSNWFNSIYLPWYNDIMKHLSDLTWAKPQTELKDEKPKS